MKIRLFAISLLVFVSTAFAAAPKPPQAAVASAHPLATRAGMEILDAGGNAFDAAVAVSAALSVVEPYSSGIGGGGLWLLHRSRDGFDTLVDGREYAPGAASADMYFQDRFRGLHVLQRDENGLEKCVACFLCAAACPANCIYIEAAENTATNRVSGAERYARVYNIDYNRCIFCGYCVEACPTDAITHGHNLELAPYDINAFIYRKEQLLESWPPRATTQSA